jgi:hypothetical protein
MYCRWRGGGRCGTIKDLLCSGMYTKAGVRSLTNDASVPLHITLRCLVAVDKMYFSMISKKYKGCNFTNLMYILSFSYFKVYMLPSASIRMVGSDCGEHTFCYYFALPVGEVGETCVEDSDPL